LRTIDLADLPKQSIESVIARIARLEEGRKGRDEKSRNCDFQVGCFQPQPIFFLTSSLSFFPPSPLFAGNSEEFDASVVFYVWQTTGGGGIKGISTIADNRANVLTEFSASYSNVI